ncbi:epidermis-specific secreted glycoprotein EP1-like [Quillaja saponaria]|uniref:Epidermis-specific secreted glycoprotein EP1-like n=1 Tax=Quillaja saponaria TaxID=32244 RepID=A0AAD7QHX9_QUISA|nr:epidermis-specific secreted glycoprotein EP1-like [Quillaja saponaria]
MATTFTPYNLHILLFLIAHFAIALSQVPINQQFKFINQGEFGDRIIEYDASYRVIRTNELTFLSFPFRLCFYNTTPDAYIFAIRAGVPNDESLMRWVWDANRHRPVHQNSTLSLGRDGNLVLAEADNTVVWQTNTANKGVTGLRLLPNGNLVLHDKNGKFIWQSFDHPTDTLLVGQSVRINGPNKLVGRKSELDPSDGPYSLVLDKTGFTMFLNNSGQLLTYGGWPGPNRNFGDSITFDAVPENENATAYELVLSFNSSTTNRRRLLQVRPIGNGQQLNLNKLNYNATISFLRLGFDGNLKAYTYYDKVSYLKWEESFAFFSSYFIRECGLPSKCGSYGLCTRGMCVACPSPKGLLGWSESCGPPKVPVCGKGGKFGYYKIVGVEHFLGPYLDGGEGPIKVADCKAKCDKDCKCLGYFYKEDTSKCLLAPVLGTLIRDVNTSVGYIKYSI